MRLVLSGHFLLFAQVCNLRAGWFDHGHVVCRVAVSVEGGMSATLRRPTAIDPTHLAY